MPVHTVTDLLYDTCHAFGDVKLTVGYTIPFQLKNIIKFNPGRQYGELVYPSPLNDWLFKNISRYDYFLVYDYRKTGKYKYYFLFKNEEDAFLYKIKWA